VRVGLFTDGLGDRPLAAALEWLAEELPEVRDVEIGTGGYSHAPHCDLGALVSDEPARRAWLGEIESRGFRLVALNASGNSLEEVEDARVLQDTIRLAALLEVDRVVCMSGGSREVAGGAWFPGFEDALEREWTERVLPFWDDLVSLARSEQEDLRLCLELEPGAAVFNVTTFERLAALGENIAVNLDPSHLFWQAMDPLAVISRLGGRIGFVHGKDTAVDPGGVALDGLLQRTGDATWEYATVGRGHDESWWRCFVEALAGAGYDGVVSVEHEDARTSPEAGIAEGARLLTGLIAEVAA